VLAWGEAALPAAIVLFLLSSGNVRSLIVRLCA